MLVWSLLSFYYDAKIAIIETNHKQEIQDVRTEERERCDKLQRITKDADHEIQKNLNHKLNERDAIITSLRANGTPCAIARGSSKVNGTPSTKELPQGVGERLTISEYAAIIDAEKTTTSFWQCDVNTEKLIALQQFVKEVYKINGKEI
jgi:hypothetical protein